MTSRRSTPKEIVTSWLGWVGATAVGATIAVMAFVMVLFLLLATGAITWEQPDDCPCQGNHN